MKKQNKLSELRWPIGIVLSIFGLIALSIWTIQQANIKPVVMDDFYFDTYDNVDRNINDILIKQQKFDEKYIITYDKEGFSVGTNNLGIKIISKTKNSPVENANIKIKITKPDTAQFDKMPKIADYKNGEYITEEFPIEKIGRWQIMAKITINDLTSFTKTEVNATK